MKKYINRIQHFVQQFSPCNDRVFIISLSIIKWKRLSNVNIDKHNLYTTEQLRIEFSRSSLDLFANKFHWNITKAVFEWRASITTFIAGISPCEVIFHSDDGNWKFRSPFVHDLGQQLSVLVTFIPRCTRQSSNLEAPPNFPRIERPFSYNDPPLKQPRNIIE